MLGSISALVFFSLSIALANSANEYASYVRSNYFGIREQHPLIMPDQATAVSYTMILDYYIIMEYFCI